MTPRKSAPAKSAPPKPVPPPPAPLPAELLVAPGRFGRRLAASVTMPWQYWPAPVLAALLAGVAYALLMRPGLSLAAAEAIRLARPGQSPAMTVFSHVTNGFGTFFLTSLTFGAMWGLGRLGAGTRLDGRGARVAEIYSATFTLLLPLYALCIALVLLTPAASWALNPAEVGKAAGNLLELQRAGVSSAAQTPAALLLMLTSLLGTLAQFVLGFIALRETTASQSKAALGVLLPLLPALLLQFLSVAPLVLARHW